MLIMVLNDGDTYSDLYGCKIVDIPDGIDGDEIESVLKESPNVLKTFGDDDCKLYDDRG